MIGSLFYPMPAIQSSDGLNEGMNLTNYMNSFVGLVPVQVQLGVSVPSVTFDAADGQEYSYTGFNYLISKTTRPSRPKKSKEEHQVVGGGNLKKIE